MTSTVFVNGSTLTDEDWFNDLNRLHYTIFSDPASAVAALANLTSAWPKFLAYNSATDANQTGNGASPTVDFNTEVYDIGANFSADTFTAPNTGKYLLAAQVIITDTTTAMTGFAINIVTTARTYSTNHNFNVETAGDNVTLQVSALADMTSGDTAYVTVSVSGGAGDTADILGSASLNTYFCGAQIA